MTTTMNQSNKWFGNSVHEAYASASDRTKHVRNRALYRNTMNIAAQGGLKRNGGIRSATYAPATFLNSACKSVSGETGANGCVAYYIRSAPSYENLLRVTQGIYEGRALRTGRGEVPRLRIVLGTGANAAIVRGIGISNPLVTTNKINYLSLTNNGNGSTSDLLALTPALDPVTSQSPNVAYDASRREQIDPAQCMQYPPNPTLSITYGGGGCYVFDEPS